MGQNNLPGVANTQLVRHQQWAVPSHPCPAALQPSAASHIQDIRIPLAPALLQLPRALLLPPMLPLLFANHAQGGHQLLQRNLVAAACGQAGSQKSACSKSARCKQAWVD